MMNGEIIMTTNFYVEKADEKEAAFSLGMSCFKFKELGISAFFVHEDKVGYESNSFHCLFGRLRSRLSNFKSFLIVASPAWQPKSRVVKYYGLWGALERKGAVLDSDLFSTEKALESEKGIKFFGIKEFETVKGVADVLKKEPNSCVLMINSNGFSFGEFEGFDFEGFYQEVISRIFLVRGWVLIKYFGGFDDEKKGFLVLTNSTDLLI